MRDQPIPPLDNAIFWTEYVIRHKGAPHFKSAALELTWYQYYMLDAIAFVLAVSATSFIIICYILLKICRRKSTNKVDAERKNKKKKN